jgi:hypothetical protein
MKQKIKSSNHFEKHQENWESPLTLANTIKEKTENKHEE